MFDTLTHRFTRLFQTLSGKSTLSERNLQEGLREIRMALLEANVSLSVVKSFVEDLKAAFIGEAVIESTTPTQTFIKRVHEDIVRLLDHKEATGELDLLEPNRLSKVMFCGLQGGGKTTTLAKIAHKYRDTRDILTVSLDMHRPAAEEQLQTLSKQAKVTHYHRGHETNLKKVIKGTLSHAKRYQHNLILFDTAGRTQVNQELMKELHLCEKLIEPTETLLICDVMMGQKALDIAHAFGKAIKIHSLSFSKTDAETRGGAILSVQYTLKLPIKFVGTGESISDLESFHPRRVADRLLGRGDMVTLAEKAEKIMDRGSSEALLKKLDSHPFDLQDFLNQLKQMNRMGSLKNWIKYLPGAANLNADNLDQKVFFQMRAVIESMTPKERRQPFLLNGSRKKRIAMGSGQTVLIVNQLLKKFQEMKKLMKKMKNPSKIKSFMKENFGDMDMSRLENLMKKK